MLTAHFGREGIPMRLLPPSLFGRLLLFLTGGLVIAQLLSAAILLQDRDQALYHAIGDHVAQRIAAIVALLDTLSDEERQRLATALDLPPTRIRLDLPWQTELEPDERYHAKLFRTLLKRQLGSDRPFQVEINDDLPPPPVRRPVRSGPAPAPAARDRPAAALAKSAHAVGLALCGEIRLRDGATVTFEQVLPEDVIAWPARLLLILLVLLVSVAVLAALAVRALTRPLAVLADAAGELGRDIHRPPLDEAGPLEVRRAAHAFNTMQERLIRYIEDRDRILAAVSHDLKTPITRCAAIRTTPAKWPSRRLKARLRRTAPPVYQRLAESLMQDAGHRCGITGAARPAVRCRPLALNAPTIWPHALKTGQRPDRGQRTLQTTDPGP
ncbi:MAG: HAMP domain-containing protein [Candidatus Competibacteraceae bacterium]|nr:HAMP domain-containing protein [Candidatus Competibacteraceae bacterium]